jgi:hypothetical protein
MLVRLQILIQSLHERVVDELHASHKPLFYAAIPYCFEDRLALLFPQDQGRDLPDLVAILEAEPEPDYNDLAATFLSASVLPAIHAGASVLGPSIGRTRLVYHFCEKCQHSYYDVSIAGRQCPICEASQTLSMTYVSFQDVVAEQAA